MATTTTMPPTKHALPHAQRLRLMRSTRKLGALLGETPLLFERRSGPASKGGLRSGPRALRIDDEHRVDALGPAIPGGTRRPAVILACPLHRAPRSTDEPRPRAPRPGRAPHALPTPPARRLRRLPCGAHALPLPALPHIQPHLAHDACRRRKMAKLVFPRVPRRASTLTSSVPEFALERRRAVAVAAEEKTAPHPSFNADGPFWFPSTVPFAPSPELRASFDTSASGASGSSGEHLLPHADGGMHRREQGWSGEWRGRVGNMDDVVRSLRGLKVK